MRLRCMMAPSDVEHQLKFLVYTLERASQLADQSGVAWASLLPGRMSLRQLCNIQLYELCMYHLCMTKVHSRKLIFLCM